MKQEYLWLAATIAILAREAYHYFKALSLRRRLEQAEQQIINDQAANLHEWSEEAREAYEKDKKERDNTNDSN